MAVRAGYKQTEVGVIPEDWTVESIRHIAHIQTGPFGTLLKAAEYSTLDGVPLISVREIGEGVIIADNRTPSVPPSVVRRMPEYVLKSADIVFGRKGAVDRSALVANNQQGWFLGSDGIRIRFTIPCDSRFISYQFQQKKIRLWLLQHATGTTMPSLNQEVLGRVNVSLPKTIAEQTAIAAVLADTDSLIQSLDRLIAKKRLIKQGAMQELLTGKKRLPGFNGEWEQKNVGDMAEVGRGRVISHKEISTAIEARYPVYSSQTSNNGIMGYIDTYDFEGEYVTWTTDGVNAGKVFYRSGRFNCTNVCGAIKLKVDNPQFIARLLDTVTSRYVSKNLANPKLMNAPMKQITVFVPRLTEQTAIANILSDMDAEIEALEEKRSKYKAIKQGMMQALLTGRVRLI